MDDIAIVELGGWRHNYQVSPHFNNRVHIYYYDDDITTAELQKEIEDLMDWYSVVIFPDWA